MLPFNCFVFLFVCLFVYLWTWDLLGFVWSAGGGWLQLGPDPPSCFLSRFRPLCLALPAPAGRQAAKSKERLRDMRLRSVGWYQATVWSSLHYDTIWKSIVCSACSACSGCVRLINCDQLFKSFPVWVKVERFKLIDHIIWYRDWTLALQSCKVEEFIPFFLPSLICHD